MDKRDIIEFFDRYAPQWDADMIRSDEIIGEILDGAGVEEGKTVLDVACGTGVLIPDYLKRDVAAVTGVDISPEMIRIAREKFLDGHDAALISSGGVKTELSFVCADVAEMPFVQQYDCIVIYNAFPHFPNPAELIHTLAGYLKPGGTLTVAHGMSRAKIDAHHEGAASKVSMGLMHEDELADIFAEDLEVIVKISDESMYQVTGMRKTLHSI